MASRLTTYQHIADILSFKVDADTLQQKLKETKVDWDAIVVEGSRHLVLPALYCRLKAKNSLHLIPEELQTYLGELTAINRNRNESILEQVHAIFDLFTQHNIDHVFLKGAAMLASDYYEDIAERMVGDIDILIANDQLQKAFDLMIDNGYRPTAIATFGSRYFGHKHLPRLSSSCHISAVELHEKLFMSYTTDLLKNEDILSQKRVVNTLPIPSYQEIEDHNSLNLQINDYGYYYNILHFRTAYDSIVLNQQADASYQLGKSNKVLNNYYMKVDVFFKDLNGTLTNRSTFNSWLYKCKTNSPFLTKASHYFLSVILTLRILLIRSYYFISNKNYRKDVLEDRKRVFNTLKTKF